VNESTISVPEIHCDHCKMTLERALGTVPGVTRAIVDVPGAYIDVAYSEPATIETIRETIEGQGYEVAQG
jgi:copper chaperone